MVPDPRGLEQKVQRGTASGLTTANSVALGTFLILFVSLVSHILNADR